MLGNHLKKLIILVFLLVLGCSSHDTNWDVQKNAIPSTTHPLAGFWKSPDCSDAWRLAIGPEQSKNYYVSFCGPGGCFAKGEYRPLTTIYNDSNYRVISNDKIEVVGADGFTKYIRCTGR